MLGALVVETTSTVSKVQAAAPLSGALAMRRS
jgi:hypothetical protein